MYKNKAACSAIQKAGSPGITRLLLLQAGKPPSILSAAEKKRKKVTSYSVVLC